MAQRGLGLSLTLCRESAGRLPRDRGLLLPTAAPSAPKPSRGSRSPSTPAPRSATPPPGRSPPTAPPATASSSPAHAPRAAPPSSPQAPSHAASAAQTAGRHEWTGADMTSRCQRAREERATPNRDPAGVVADPYVDPLQDGPAVPVVVRLAGVADRVKADRQSSRARECSEVSQPGLLCCRTGCK